METLKNICLYTMLIACTPVIVVGAAYACYTMVADLIDRIKHSNRYPRR